MIPPVVDLAWWHEHFRTMAAEEAITADVRWYLDGRSGQAAYHRGHLPGAVFVDLDRWLAGPADEQSGRHPLPSPQVFAEGMSSLGIGDTSTVVAYDDAGGVIAARLVWLLRALGHNAALLDGGLQRYTGPLETDSTPRARASFSVQMWPETRLVSADDVADATEGTAIIIDARPADRFAGAPDDVDPRPGHIPGARSLPCRENLDAEGAFLPVERLRERFAAVGIGIGRGDGLGTGTDTGTGTGTGTGLRDGDDVISYCGSGVTACHNLLAMEHAGFGLGRLYPGSWSQWCRDPARPAALGPA